ncbi:MAG TPA: adenylyl-sulfate kinase, partial [Bacteroidetes bacterium]|nr:adenylyl-sulfate kinase [Bacteroidota bacterium]
MSGSLENIFPIHKNMLSQEEKESLLHQRGVVFWLTGLSGAGKSSIAVAAARMLHEQGLLTKLLDGDNVRRRINANLGFTLADRQENIRRVAEIARLFRETGVVTLCAFISPTHKMRALAREII